MAARTKAKNQQETGRLSCFYDLTEENLDEWGEEEEDSILNSIDLSNVKMLNEKPALHETPPAKREESPCRKTTDPDSSQESENSAIHVPAPEETPRGGLVNKETPPSAVAPSYTGNILHERHSLLDVKSSSVKLLLLRQDTSEDGNTRLIIEKIWDLKTPVKIGRRLSQSADITNGLFNGRLISRKHAIVYAEGDKVLLCDVGSSHGTFINGQRVVTFKELHDGDRLSLGQFSNGKAPYIVQIIQGAGRKEADDSEAEPSASTESKKRKRENENDGIDDVAYFIFDGLENVENRIAKRLRVSSAISAVLGGVVGGLSVGCAIVGLANMG